MPLPSMLLDWNLDRCQKKLKQLEHLAYSGVVQAFRAQGVLTKEKKKILQELQSMLNVSVSLHKCELRQAVNREELHTIAYRTAGPNTASEWAIEGKRLCPLLPRAVEKTDNVILADALVKIYKAARAKQKQMTDLTVNDLPNVICSDCSAHDHENLITFEDIKKHIVQSVERKKLKANAAKAAEENSKKVVLKRKRTDSVHSNDVQHKVVVIDPSPEGGFRFHETASEEIITLPPAHESSVVSFQTLTGEENNNHIAKGSVHKAVLAPLSSRPTISVPLTKCQTMPPLNVTVSSTVLQKSIAVPIFKTAIAPSALPTVSQGKTAVSIPFISASQSSVIVSSIPSTVSASVVNSLSTPLCSVAASHHVINSLPGSVSDGTMKTRAKILAPAKKLVRPRLTRTNFNIGSPSLLNHLSNPPQLPSPNTVSPLQKAVISLKARSPSLGSTSSASNIVSSQVSSTASTFKRPISPITMLPRIGSSIANSAKVKPPVTLKYCQTKMPVTPPKSAVLSKCITKTALTSTLGGRSVVNTSSKSSPKSNTLDVIGSSTLKSSSSQVLPPNKVSGSITLQQKVLATQSLAKTTTAAKSVPYRNEGGLKIVSQNVPNNRILPKPGTSTTSGKAAVTTSSGLTKNARIVNLATPIKLDRSAFSLHSNSSASTSTVRLNSSSSISTSGGRATTPAKPNVIVVHKAQVYPQTSGSAFVMPSSSPLSRIPEETNDEAVTSAVQHKDTGKISSQENSKALLPIQSLASSAVTKSCSLTTLPISTTSHQIEQSKREKRLERHSNIKLPGTAEAITLIQRKIPGKLSSSPEKVKLRTNQQAVSANIPENKTSATTKESVSSNETTHSLEYTKSTSGCAALKDVNETNKAESSSIESKLDVSDVITTVSQINARVMPIKCEDKKECTNIPRKVITLKNTSVLNEASPCLKDNSPSDLSTREAQSQVCLQHMGEINSIDCFNDNEKKSVVFENDGPDFENSMLLVNQDAMTSSIDIQSINLDQLQEGEVLALQPQDAAELLSQHGPLSKEVIELLQQAGLEVVNVPTEDDQTHDNVNVCYVGSCLQSTEITSDSFEEITSEDGNESSISLDIPYTCHSRLKIPKCT